MLKQAVEQKKDTQEAVNTDRSPGHSEDIAANQYKESCQLMMHKI